MKIDWKRKLGSRKFWAAAAGLIAAVAVVCGADEDSVAAITAILSAAGVLAAYILGESIVDSRSVGQGAEPSSLPPDGGNTDGGQG